VLELKFLYKDLTYHTDSPLAYRGLRFRKEIYQVTHPLRLTISF